MAPAEVPATRLGPTPRSQSAEYAPASPIPFTPPPSKTRSANGWFITRHYAGSAGLCGFKGDVRARVDLGARRRVGFADAARPGAQLVEQAADGVELDLEPELVELLRGVLVDLAGHVRDPHARVVGHAQGGEGGAAAGRGRADVDHVDALLELDRLGERATGDQIGRAHA